ncbi:hypothetical protein UPYG_G00186730 [Umbra pygmaea]|uniref:Uncharacterized protein n=1 Tax=Umbra pygmaea TaxID=75934 RepID=A0ABD0XEP6_UMBPY
MDNGKRKGGAEKARIKKKKALETDAAKCSKLSTFFQKKTNEDDEAALQQQLPLDRFAANSKEQGPVTFPRSSHQPNTPEWAVSETKPGPSCEEETNALTVKDTGKLLLYHSV